jgi:peptide subunit release factor 1 (eRF1)
MTLLWNDELRQLAEVESTESGAITFYFQPQVPQDPSHREELITVKDLVKEALHRQERNGNHRAVRADLERIQKASEHLRGNHSRAKAIFACSDKNIWREFDLPAISGKTQLHVNSRFRLKPIASAVLSKPHCSIALIDSEKARIFDLYMDEISEREQITGDNAKRVRTDGFNGYEAGHIERHVENGVMRHMKKVAERLLEIRNAGNLDYLLIGCRQEMRPEIEPHLHPYVKKSLVGTFTVDPAVASAQEVKEIATTMLNEQSLNEQEARIREVIGESQRNGRGSLGLRHVITSLERGEVQTLLIGDNFVARAVECTHCGHLDTRLVDQCAVCGHVTREWEDVTDVLISRALRLGVHLLYINDDKEFLKAGNVGALLRFRADQNTPEKLAS